MIKVDRIMYDNTDGNVAYTGVGFEPKALIFWTYVTPSDDTITNDLRFMIGFAAIDDEVITQGCVSARSVDEGGASVASRRIVAVAISIILIQPSTLQCEASLVSMDDDGFTLNWTNTTSGTSFPINYMAIGGPDIEAASVVEWTTPTVTGDYGVTGAGFQPDVVLHIGAAAAALGGSSGAVLWFGAMTTTAQWALSLNSSSGSLASDTQRYQNTNTTLNYVISDLSLALAATYVSMDIDGFTININPTLATARYVYSLCIKTNYVKVGSFAKSASPATSTAVSSVGFPPEGVLLVTDNHGVVATGGSNISLGGASAAGGFGGAVHDDDAQANMVADSYGMDNACIADISSSAANYIGDIDSLDSDGFTVGWPTNDATTDTIMYLAFYGGTIGGQPVALRDWVKHVGRPWRPGRGL